MAMAKIKGKRVEQAVPDAPVLSFNDSTNLLSASSPLGNSQIEVSENGVVFGPYTGQINVGEVARPAGYWKFKIKAATNRPESATVNSPEFTVASTTPVAPTLTQDDTLNTIAASHPLGISEILVSGNNGVFVQYTATISVGNVAQPAGYWKFKTKAATGRNESPISQSAEFTVDATVTNPPTLSADDTANTLSASSSYGTSEILVSENGGSFAAYAGTINVGDVARSAGYWQFKIKAATGRPESAVVGSPAFTVAPVVTANAYTLSAPAAVSAGVYKTDGTLVRTLFSGRKQLAGTYPVKWDGTDDFLSNQPNQNYNVKVLSNNVKYECQGTIGNTSLSFTDRNAIHRSLDPVSNLLIIGTNAYYSVGYDEATPSMFKFALSNPQVKINSFDGYGNQTTDYCCTDGTNIYWTCWDNYDVPGKPGTSALEQSFVFATKVSDNTLVSFSGGRSTQVTYGAFYASVINYKTSHAKASGIAYSGNYLFVSYAANNLVDVLNRTTGALVRSLTLTNPTCMTGDGANLWLCTATNSLQKYVVNADGSLGAASLSISGLSSPVDVRVNGATLAVLDGGSSQQVKTFNTGTGASIWTMGQAGGMLSTAIVSNDRFGFWVIGEGDGIKRNRGGIAFASDGSFWLSDPTNKRIMHFDPSRAFVESIIYQGKTYTCYADPNNHARVMANLQEFQVSYTSNNIFASWSPKYNWEGNFLAGYNLQDGIRDITTLSNGRTYALIITSGGFEVVELIAATGIRYTGFKFNVGSAKMYPDGSVYTLYGTGLGETQEWQKSTRTGFDGSNNPIYTAFTTILTNASTDAYQARLSGAKIRPWEITASNQLIRFRGNIDKDAITGQSNEPQGAYHLEGISSTTGQSIWKTLQNTRKEYFGDFPFDAFDVGNGPAEYAGNVAVAIGKNIFAGFNGEFWKQSQTNKWFHHYDNGLQVGQFGATGPDYNGDPVTYAAFAGNAFSPAVVEEFGDYYLYHNDESVHGGILRWKISGLNTIQEQVVPINTSFVRSVESVVAGVDLMAGLPVNSVLPNSVNGWTRSSANTGNFTAQTSVKTYDIRKPVDIFTHYFGTTTVGYSITRGLGSNIGATAWNLTGRISFDKSMPNFSDAAGLNQYVDVLDNTGKIITRLYHIINFGVSPASASILMNNTTLLTGESNFIRFVAGSLRNFSISKSGTAITASYDGASAIAVASPYEAGANIANPTTLRLTFTSNGASAYEKYMAITDLVFNSTLP